MKRRTYFLVLISCFLTILLVKNTYAENQHDTVGLMMVDAVSEPGADTSNTVVNSYDRTDGEVEYQEESIYDTGNILDYYHHVLLGEYEKCIDEGNAWMEKYVFWLTVILSLMLLLRCVVKELRHVGKKEDHSNRLRLLEVLMAGGGMILLYAMRENGFGLIQKQWIDSVEGTIARETIFLAIIALIIITLQILGLIIYMIRYKEFKRTLLLSFYKDVRLVLFTCLLMEAYMILLESVSFTLSVFIPLLLCCFLLHKNLQYCKYNIIVWILLLYLAFAAVWGILYGLRYLLKWFVFCEAMGMTFYSYIGTMIALIPYLLWGYILFEPLYKRHANVYFKKKEDNDGNRERIV